MRIASAHLVVLLFVYCIVMLNFPVLGIKYKYKLHQYLHKDICSSWFNIIIHLIQFKFRITDI